MFCELQYGTQANSRTLASKVLPLEWPIHKCIPLQALISECKRVSCGTLSESLGYFICYCVLVDKYVQA